MAENSREDEASLGRLVSTLREHHLIWYVPRNIVAGAAVCSNTCVGWLQFDTRVDSLNSGPFVP